MKKMIALFLCCSMILASTVSVSADELDTDLSVQEQVMENGEDLSQEVLPEETLSEDAISDDEGAVAADMQEDEAGISEVGEETAAEPMAEPITEPAPEAAAEPAAVPETEAVSEPETQSAVESAAGPVAETTAEPETEEALLEEQENVDQGICGPNLNWTLDDHGTLTISGTGEMDDNPWDKNAVVSLVIGEGAENIVEEAFSGCSNLESVSLPESLCVIGAYAFADCVNLTAIDFSPTEQLYIDSEAFEGCYDLNTVSINGAVSIGSWAFCDCINLETVDIESITELEMNAFENCTALSSVSVIDCRTIEKDAFTVCGNLATVSFTINVVTVRSGAFGDCSDNLTVIYGGTEEEWSNIEIDADNQPLENATIVYPQAKTVQLSQTSYTYDGTEKCPDVTVFRADGSEVSSTLYSVEYINNVSVGTAQVCVRFLHESTVLYAEFAITNGAPVLSEVKAVLKGVSVSWQQVAGAEKYRVYRKVNGGSWKKLADTTALTYTDETAVSGENYSYTVRCISLDGQTTSGYDAVGKSIDYIAAPKVSSVQNANGGVKVSWAESAGAEKYRVYKKTGSESWKKVADTTALTYTDKTAVSGTTYNYTVRCIASDGKATSAYDTKGKSITYIAAPVISSVQNANGGVKVTWAESAGAEKYRVFRKTGSGSWAKVADTTALTYTDKTAVSGTTYSYTARCITSDGKTFTSAYDTTGKSVKYIAAPVLSSVQNANGGVKVTWEKSTGAAKYRVFRKTGSGSWAKVADTTAASYLDKTAKSGTTYSYTVRCISSDGKTYTSAYNTKGKSVAYIAAPVVSSVAKVTGGVKITWAKSAGAAKYRVFRKTGSGSWTKLADTTSLNYTDKSVKSGTKYSYTVRCISSDGKSYTSAYDTTGKSITY